MENNTIFFNYENKDKRRIYISEGGKTLINIILPEPPVKLSIPGNYKLVFTVFTSESTLEKRLDLYVGISQ
ncbi:hypothetical protein [Marinitoga lauensis]|uniref:hypothetical protein n=1 Tax=Marinitoga lauensis TaxID=2201189 RepID=UPI001011EA1E|nr:hypothetical protein [Marinitoga lauensis]